MSRVLLLTVLAALLLGSAFAQDAEADTDALTLEAMRTYADIAYANYSDSLALAEALRDTIHAFVDAPSEETFEAAKQAWLVAQEPYGQTEAFRFYGGPIDDARNLEPLINAWPLDENYVDYVDGAPDAGVINDPDTYPEITAELLVELNEQGAEENISTGYHAIEFLLWGQDLSADTNGQRPYTDYTTAPNAERRAAYLSLAADLLVEHLGEVTADWDPEDEDSFYNEFVNMAPADGMQMMLTGMGVLAKSELAGERMFTAYDNQDQEDEHSCFSDNTHRDIITNFMGIQNLYLGRYTRLDGSIVEGIGLTDVVEAVDPALNADIVAMLDEATTLLEDLYVPFDQAIVRPEGRPGVLDSVFTLQDIGDKFSEVAFYLGIPINTALPE